MAGPEGLELPRASLGEPACIGLHGEPGLEPEGAVRRGGGVRGLKDAPTGAAVLSAGVGVGGHDLGGGGGGDAGEGAARFKGVTTEDAHS